MDFNPPKGKGKKGLISKTWERCKSFSGGIGRKGHSFGTQHGFKMKCKSWARNQEKRSCKVAPDGYFSIYVGSEKQRFVIKTEYVNHPLFKMLLEEAESEYGYSSEGPLVLPCEVDHFIKVLIEMDSDSEGIDKHQGCIFVTGSCTSYHLLTPPSLVPMNNF